MSKVQSPSTKDMPLDIVGSSTFGRDPKILASRTFNMITADDFLIDNAGYRKVIKLSNKGTGRSIFTSIPANSMICVINNQVYSIQIYSQTRSNQFNYTTQLVGTLNSYSGSVSIDENNAGQIAICDGNDLHIYNHRTNDFQKAVIPEGFVPTYVTYQDGRFIITDKLSSLWAISAVGDGLSWHSGNSGQALLGAIQTKPDFSRAVIRVPGKGNLIFVFGETVGELWTDVGANPFPYKKSSSVNFDYGILSTATLAASGGIVAWLGANEKSGPVIMYSTSADVSQVSTDGINYKFSLLNNPRASTAMFYMLSGHLIYQLTFYDPKDNFTIAYDFTDKKFYDLTDQDMNYHIAADIAFFNDDYYFVSLNDGCIYQMDASYTSYDYGEFSADGSPKVYDIPRIRVCSNVRAPSSNRFVVNSLSFTMEQGSDTQNTGLPNYDPRIGLSQSQNGGISFGTYSTKPVYRAGNRINKLQWWQVGAANDYVPQFRFWGKGPWKATNGLVSIQQ